MIEMLIVVVGSIAIVVGALLWYFFTMAQIAFGAFVLGTALIIYSFFEYERRRYIRRKRDEDSRIARARHERRKLLH